MPVKNFILLQPLLFLRKAFMDNIKLYEVNPEYIDDLRGTPFP